MQHINTALLDARFESGLTRDQVARAIGLADPDAIGLYERGRRTPTLRVALKLEIIYRRPIAYLFPDLYASLQAEVRGLRGATGSSAARRAS